MSNILLPVAIVGTLCLINSKRISEWIQLVFTPYTLLEVPFASHPLVLKNTSLVKRSYVPVAENPHHFMRNFLLNSGPYGKYTLAQKGGKCIENGLTLHSPKDKILITLIKLGSEVCGHKDIVHGGLISALFDELLGELFFKSQKKHGFTAKLTINYRAPIPAGSLVVFAMRVVKVEGRKHFLDGQVRLAMPELDYSNINDTEVFSKWIGSTLLFAEADALFVTLKTADT